MYVNAWRICTACLSSTNGLLETTTCQKEEKSITTWISRSISRNFRIISCLSGWSVGRCRINTIFFSLSNTQHPLPTTISLVLQSASFIQVFLEAVFERKRKSIPKDFSRSDSWNAGHDSGTERNCSTPIFFCWHLAILLLFLYMILLIHKIVAIPILSKFKIFFSWL